MKLSFLLCFVVFTSFVVGQFDQGRDELSPLSLSQTVDTTRHDEFSDSVLNQGVINNNCREAFHEVRNVRTDNGPMNSGTYFLIEFDTDINSQPINFYLYDPIADYEFEIHDTPTAGSSTGPVGTCPSNSNCQFEYYCDLYEETDTSTLEIIVFTPSGTLSSENSTYDLTFTQFVDVVSVIPSSRTFTQSTGVTDPFDSSNLGPENFIHYYHNFEATANELVDGRSFFIILDNFNTNTDGDVTVCYSPSNLVGTDQDVSSVSPLSPVNGNPDPTQSATVFASDCPVTCAAGNINNGVGFVYLPVDACDLCELGDLWIGVRPPSNTIESTYTISLTTDNLEPSITTISSYPFMTDSQLQEECIVDEGDYSCNDYYLLNNINLQDNSYITVELFGVSNMDATVQLTQSGLGGVSSCCASSINSCNVNANNGDDYCSFTFYGCNSLSGDYYITVIDNSDFVTDIPSFYTLRVTSGTYSAKSISPFAEPVHETNSLRPNQYAHYSVDFTGFDIEASTNFIAEMYASDEFSETMFFSWNSGSLAGDQGCFEYGGICATNSDCDYYDGNCCQLKLLKLSELYYLIFSYKYSIIL